MNGKETEHEKRRDGRKNAPLKNKQLGGAAVFPQGRWMSRKKRKNLRG